MNDAADVAAWVSAMHSAYNLLVVISGNNAILRDDPHCERRKSESVARNIDKGKKTLEYLKDKAPLDNLIELAELPRVEIDDTHSVPSVLAMSDSPMRPKVQIDDTHSDPTALAMSASPMSDTKDIVLKTKTTEKVKPTRRRCVIKGVRTCSRIAPRHTKSGTPRREDNIYGPVLNAGKLNRALCREYLRQWLTQNGKEYHPCKEAKRKNDFRLEILLKDFGKDGRIDNGRS